MKRIWLLGAALLLAVGCSNSSVSTVGLPPSPPSVTVRMEDGRIVYDSVIRPGRTIFRVVNVGSDDHGLMMFPAPDDYPPIDVQLHGDERRFVAPFAQLFPMRPGGSGSFAVDLQPGQRYIFLDPVAGKDGVINALQGMDSEFVVLSALGTDDGLARVGQP